MFSIFSFAISFLSPQNNKKNSQTKTNSKMNCRNKNIWQKCWNRKSNQIKEYCEMREKKTFERLRWDSLTHFLFLSFSLSLSLFWVSEIAPFFCFRLCAIFSCNLTICMHSIGFELFLIFLFGIWHFGMCHCSMMMVTEFGGMNQTGSVSFVFAAF